MYKAKERCVEAQIEEVISYSERQGYRENIIKERVWILQKEKTKVCGVLHTIVIHYRTIMRENYS